MIIGSLSASHFKNNQTCKSQNNSNMISNEMTLKYFLKTFPDSFIWLLVKTKTFCRKLHRRCVLPPPQSMHVKVVMLPYSSGLEMFDWPSLWKCEEKGCLSSIQTAIWLGEPWGSRNPIIPGQPRANQPLQNYSHIPSSLLSNLVVYMWLKWRNG